MVASDDYPVTGSTRLLMHELTVRADRDSWVIGRVETGEFVRVPDAGKQAAGLLAAGVAVDDARAALRRKTGADIDVADFAAALIELGFVAEVDGVTVAQPPCTRPTLPWLHARHLRWLLHPAVAVAAGLGVLASVVMLFAEPRLLPGYRDLLWSHSGGAVILGNAALSWTIIMVHELAHLGTARAAGVPGRISFGTRLQFLVMHTDVTGIWAAPRRTRLTVYCAGITTNLVIAAVCLLAAAVSPAGLAHHLLAATALLSVLAIPAELLVFMRTDLYFVLQDLAGCANLYADGTAYAQYIWRLLVSRLGRGGPPPVDPSRGLPTAERRAVRAYTILLVTGTAACLSVAAAVTLPAMATLVARATASLADAASLSEALDAVAVLAVTGTVACLWCQAWWRRHGHRVRRFLGCTPRVEGRR
jgi:putative peptide zinc metalloprotease protein